MRVELNGCLGARSPQVVKPLSASAASESTVLKLSDDGSAWLILVMTTLLLDAGVASIKPVGWSSVTSKLKFKSSKSRMSSNKSGTSLTRGTDSTDWILSDG